MKEYNFDQLIDRRGTDCVKTDGLKEHFGRVDLIPLWVADMDFRTPPCIVEAIRERCEHEVFGYTSAPDEYYKSIIRWVKELHGWDITRDWISYIPGIVKGIGFCVQCFTKPGDKVIIQPPVYPPFRNIPTLQGRVVVNNPLKQVDGVYQMDLDHLESIIDADCKMLILCNPHNPGGIVWDKNSLIQLAEICSKHHIIVISDEIHAEIVYPGITHHPFASVSKQAAACSITFMAPSKTFNIAGIVSSYAIVPDPVLRDKFFHFLEAGELNSAHLFAYTATIAAYTHGDAWRQQMIAYIRQNVDFVNHFLQQHIPQIKAYIPQASFLIWLDCRELGLDQKTLVAFFTEKAHLALNDGGTFGTAGEGYMRLNIGCPRSILEKALLQLKAAIEE